MIVRGNPEYGKWEREGGGVGERDVCECGRGERDVNMCVTVGVKCRTWEGSEEGGEGTEVGGRYFMMCVRPVGGQT